MDDSGASNTEHLSGKSRVALPHSDEFVSFMDDLNKQTGFAEVPGDSGFTDKGVDLFAGMEPLHGHDSHSVCSPTTVASEELHGVHRSEHFNAVIPSNSSGSREEPAVNFDNALDVAFNTIVQEQPKQIWETGIWKYIFGNNDSELDFDVWGRPLKRPTPAVWGVEQSALDKDPLELRNAVVFGVAISWTLCHSNQMSLGEIRGKLTYKGALSFGLRSPASGMMVAIWSAGWVRCATRLRCSTCLHMFSQGGLR